MTRYEHSPWNDPVHLETLLTHLREGVFVVVDGHIAYANEPFAKLCGYDRDEVVGLPIAHVVAPEDREMVLSRYAARMAGKETPSEYEFRLLRGDSGERIWVSISVGVVPDAPAPTITGTLRDLTELKKTRSRLDASEADIGSIIENMPDVFYRADMNGTVTAISPSCREGIGYTPEEMIGRNLADFYADPAQREKVVEAIKGGAGKSQNVEHQMRHKDGSIIWVSTNAYLRYDANGTPFCVEGIARVITDRKELELKLEWLASTDVLTGLKNRRAFMIRFEEEIQRAVRHGHPLTVLSIDLDRFKEVNDSAGHLAGDTALTHFADLCRALLRTTDVIGRVGGEEFALLLPETGEPEGMRLAERLREEIASTPLLHEGGTIPLSVSIGVTSLRKTNGSIDQLMAEADRALYAAKEAGRNRVMVAPV